MYIYKNPEHGDQLNYRIEVKTNIQQGMAQLR